MPYMVSCCECHGVSCCVVLTVSLRDVSVGCDTVFNYMLTWLI